MLINFVLFYPWLYNKVSLILEDFFHFFVFLFMQKVVNGYLSLLLIGIVETFSPQGLILFNQLSNFIDSLVLIDLMVCLLFISIRRIAIAFIEGVSLLPIFGQGKMRRIHVTVGLTRLIVPSHLIIVKPRLRLEGSKLARSS